MSGTDITAKHEDALEQLEAILDRKVALEAVSALADAVLEQPGQPADLSKVAFGFDSGVFMRLATHRRSADILDYLLQHESPLIIPGQAIQEFWNNHLNVVDSVPSSIKKKFDQLAQAASKVDAQFADFEHKTKAMLSDFQSQFGYVYDENTRRNLAKTFSILRESAHCSYVPRTRFGATAEMRKRTKTPPGFKDGGDGDFFVWADFLFGLLTCGSEGERGNFEHVVLLTGDEKLDWSSKGTPHPVLSAEIRTLFGVSLNLWTLDRFAAEVDRVL